MMDFDPNRPVIFSKEIPVVVSPLAESLIIKGLKPGQQERWVSSRVEDALEAMRKMIQREGSLPAYAVLRDKRRRIRVSVHLECKFSGSVSVEGGQYVLYKATLLSYKEISKG
jgi:hypothetical protein